MVSFSLSPESSSAAVAHIPIIPPILPGARTQNGILTAKTSSRTSMPMASTVTAAFGTVTATPQSAQPQSTGSVGGAGKSNLSQLLQMAVSRHQHEQRQQQLQNGIVAAETQHRMTDDESDDEEGRLFMRSTSHPADGSASTADWFSSVHRTALREDYKKKRKAALRKEQQRHIPDIRASMRKQKKEAGKNSSP